MPWHPENRSFDAAAWIAWLPVIVGLLVLYIPTFYGLSAWVWRQEEYAHGPIILVVICWLIWRQRVALLALPDRVAPVPGFILLAAFAILLVLDAALVRVIRPRKLQIAA